MRLPRIFGPTRGRLCSLYRVRARKAARRQLGLVRPGAVPIGGPGPAPGATPSRAVFALGPHAPPDTDTASRRPTRADHSHPADPGPPADSQATSSPSRSAERSALWWWLAALIASPILSQSAEAGGVLAIPCPCRLAAPRQKGGTAPGACKGGSVPRSLRSLLYSPSLRADLCIPP